jgi:hypothetical protein
MSLDTNISANHKLLLIDCDYIRNEVCKPRVWYTPADPLNTVSPELLEHGKKVMHLATKQWPSALALRGFGNPSLQRHVQKLLPTRMRFEQMQEAEDGTKSFLDLDRSRLNDEARSVISSILSDDKEEEEEEESEDQKWTSVPYTRVKYEDPFKTLSYYAYWSTVSSVPYKPVVWFADAIRLTDKIPARYFTKDYTGKAGCSFPALARVEDRIHLLQYGTFWGQELHKLRTSHAEKNVRAWARNLWERVKAFLKGMPDPFWSKKRVSRFYGAQWEPRSTKVRANRFIEMLRTVDGMLAQRFIASPEEKWNYQKADRFFLYAISHLITDEFYDGQLACPVEDYPTTYYSILKKARKDVKASMTREVKFPAWLQYFSHTLKRAEKYPEHRRTYVYAVLCQTRGAATPPLVVTAESKVKLLRTLQIPSEKIAAKTIRRAVLMGMEEIPDVAYTGLATKANIGITTASCWEHNRKEYGTLQAINEIVASADLGVAVPTRDLDTLQVNGTMDYDAKDFGTYLFWACLDTCMKTPLEDLYSVSVVMVDEPGKSRAVTKGRACLKVILDVLNKICSAPLKHLRSSRSGMAKANHGWNFFQDLFTGELGDIVFDIDHTDYDTTLEDVTFKTHFYKPVFISSTDYTTATDYMNQKMAYLIADLWMTKLGIPKGLKRMALQCCTPRWVYFKGAGPLEEIGEPVEGQIRRVRMVRGILMGDPLTKVILHLTNIGVRKASTILPALGGRTSDWSHMRYDPTVI